MFDRCFDAFAYFFALSARPASKADADQFLLRLDLPDLPDLPFGLPFPLSASDAQTSAPSFANSNGDTGASMRTGGSTRTRGGLAATSGMSSFFRPPPMPPLNAFGLDHEDGDDDGGEASGFLSLQSLASSSSSSMALMASMSSLLDPASALNSGFGGASHFNGPPATVSLRLPWLPAIATHNTTERTDTGAFRVANGLGGGSHAGHTATAFHHDTAAADRSQTVATNKPTHVHTPHQTETAALATHESTRLIPPGSADSTLSSSSTLAAPPNDKAPRSLTETASANQTLPSQAQALHEEWMLVRWKIESSESSESK